jgi:hypothetical protein
LKKARRKYSKIDLKLRLRALPALPDFPKLKISSAICSWTILPKIEIEKGKPRNKLKNEIRPEISMRIYILLAVSCLQTI